MTIKVGDQLCDGKVVVAEIDENSLVTKITVPADTDGPTQQPLTITFDPAVPVSLIENLFKS